MNTKALKAKVEKLGVPAVSKESGVGRTTLYEWLKNPTQNLGLSRHTAVVDAVAAIEKERAAEGSNGEYVVTADEYIDVPVFDIKASAGAGALVADDTPMVYERFRMSFLHGLVDGGFDQLSIITVTGDSMESTLRPGDQILVDRSAARWAGDGIYVLQIDGVLQVKRLQRDDDGSLLIRSDNPQYQTIKPKKGLPFQVIGRVVWFARALR